MTPVLAALTTPLALLDHRVAAALALLLALAAGVLTDPGEAAAKIYGTR